MEEEDKSLPKGQLREHDTYFGEKINQAPSRQQEPKGWFNFLYLIVLLIHSSFVTFCIAYVSMFFAPSGLFFVLVPVVVGVFSMTKQSKHDKRKGCSVLLGWGFTIVYWLYLASISK
jgi:hypothetical protein